MDDTEDGQGKLQRYEAANRRAYNAVFRQLQAMQGDRLNRQPSELPTPVLYAPDPEPATEPEQPQQNSQPGKHEITKRTRAVCLTLYQPAAPENGDENFIVATGQTFLFRLISTTWKFEVPVCL